jgi:predicted TIM-barrel fold metal-dependent hydrolase
VFGSGYPYLNPGGALEFLKRLDIDGGDKRKIAGENLANLLNWGAYENN